MENGLVLLLLRSIPFHSGPPLFFLLEGIMSTSLFILAIALTPVLIGFAVIWELFHSYPSEYHIHERTKAERKKEKEFIEQYRKNIEAR